MLYSLYHQTLSNTTNPAIIELLQCLTASTSGAIMYSTGLYRLLSSLLPAVNCSEVKCPCCFMESPIQPQQLKPAPPLIQTLLKDIMVNCVRCKRDVRAGDYDTHECSTSTYQSGGEDGIKGPEKTGFH